MLFAQSVVDLPQNKVEFKKIESDAKGGDAVSMYQLAMCYRYGIPGVVEMNGTKANSWIRKAADTGNPYACVDVYNWDKAKYIAYGERAKKVLKELHTGEAYLGMSRLYIYGSENYKIWLKAAMSKGNQEAKDRLISLYKKARTSEDFSSWVEKIKKVNDDDPGPAPDLGPASAPDVVQNYDNDVDIYAPVNQQDNINTFVLIIGNENYDKLPDVPFAINDARVFKRYCEKTLGIPERNVTYVPDATAANMRESMEDLSKDVARVKGEASVIFYYAGHGLPDNKTGKAYMIPKDVSRLNHTMCYSVSDAMDALSRMNAKSVVCFLDACFSGVTRENDMLASNDGTRAIKRNVEMDVPKGNIVIFSSASNDETAWPLKDKGHGLFTYYLLKELKQKKGDVTLGELAEYMKDNVMDVTYNTKGFTRQTPTVVVSPNMSSSWKRIKLR